LYWPTSQLLRAVLTLAARLASRRSLTFAQVCQVLVYGSDADATIANRGGDPFDGAMPDVAGRKHAGHGGF
jgi:hypothetical protein